MLRALSDVAGASVADTSIRHVRDIWQAALAGTSLLRVTELAVGTLAVTAHTYTVRGERVTIPGHIGIITDLENLKLLHANPSAGVVEERPLGSVNTILGGIALNF